MESLLAKGNEQVYEFLVRGWLYVAIVFILLLKKSSCTTQYLIQILTIVILISGVYCAACGEFFQKASTLIIALRCITPPWSALSLIILKDCQKKKKSQIENQHRANIFQTSMQCRQSINHMCRVCYQVTWAKLTRFLKGYVIHNHINKGL